MYSADRCAAQPPYLLDPIQTVTAPQESYEPPKLPISDINRVLGGSPLRPYQLRDREERVLNKQRPAVHLDYGAAFGNKRSETFLDPGFTCASDVG